MRPSFPQAVLFDWDKTLASNWAAVSHALNHTLVSEGMEPWSEEEIHLRVRASARDTFPTLFGKDRWERALSTFKQAFFERQFIDLEPLHGAFELVSYLNSKGVPLGIVSNKTGTALREEVTHLGWSENFLSVVGAEDAEQDKPHIAPVDMALAPMGISRSSSVWFVGDSSIDMHCAHNAGITPVLIKSEIPEEDAEFGKYPAKIHVLDCKALLEVLYEYEI